MSEILMGEYSHNIDAKGRMSFPTKLRDILGASFFVTKALDKHCLTVYSQEEWDKLSEKVSKLPAARAADIKRFLFAGAMELLPDKQGRVMIPQNLRSYARLEKDVIVIGTSDTAEIWSGEEWNAFNDNFDTDDMIAVMNGLDF